MRKYLLIFIFFVISCSSITGPKAEISWRDVAGTTWGLTEELNIKQSVHQSFRFGYGDTIYLTKTYFNPNPKTRNDSIPWTRYFVWTLYNIHYEDDPDFHSPNLVFTWKAKEYADSLYQQPVIDNSPIGDWFLWKIDANAHLLMGYVDTDRRCYYWEFDRE